MKKSTNTKHVVQIDWTKENETKIKNAFGTKTQTGKPLDLKTWKFKVLGELPKNKIAVKV
jgi:hypothetical protein|tara:strand:+ start:261 stop:440 length:180 start_codon:yes stop_codon:yes gene_type:complete